MMSDIWKVLKFYHVDDASGEDKETLLGIITQLRHTCLMGWLGWASCLVFGAYTYFNKVVG